jgi:hypothetical protein
MGREKEKRVIMFNYQNGICSNQALLNGVWVSESDISVKRGFIFATAGEQ